MKANIGIDIGSNGAAVCISEYGHVHICRFNKHTPKEIYDWFNGMAFDYDCFAIIELVHSMPGEGVASSHQFGFNSGLIEGFIIACHIPFEKKTPQTWMKFYGMKREIVRENGKEVKEKSESKTDYKKRLRNKAEQLFPMVKMTNDIADALLIANFCKEVNK